MATTLYFKDTLTNPTAIPQDGYRDMLRANDTPLANLGPWLDDVIDGNGERPFGSGDSPTGTLTPMGFWSERIAAEVTIAGSVAVTIRVEQNEGGGSGFVTGRLRARLFKITAGGSAVESPIVTADASADLPASTTETEYVFAATPAAAVTLAPHERLIVRVYVTPHVTTGFGSNALAYVSIVCSNMGQPKSLVTLTETVSMLDNGIKLYLRRTEDIGIGAFLDLSETQGTTAYTTAKTLTIADATELQWTKLVQSGSLTATELTAAGIASTANAATYVSASFTPVANRLYLLAVCHSDAAPETTIPTIATTTGLTFVQVTDSEAAPLSMAFDTIASPVHRLTVFRAMKPSGLSAGTYTVTLADAGTGCCATLIEITGVATGFDGAMAIRNPASSSTVGQSANPSGTFPETFDESYNGAIAFVGSDIATAPTVGTGYTSLGHRTYATPTTGLFTEWRATNNAVAGCTLASSDWALIAVELVAARSVERTLEWISPRVKESWVFDSAGNCSGGLYGFQSNVAADVGLRLKVFHRTPADVETLVYTVSSAEALTDSPGGSPMDWSTETGTLNQAMTFREDDRVVVRAYLIPINTMVDGYSATLLYDDDIAPPQELSYVFVYNSSQFKTTEGEAAASSRIPGGLTMGGVGN